MKTRYNGLLIIAALVFVEGVITAFAPAFPFIAASGVQSGLYAVYVTGRSITDKAITQAGGTSEVK